MFDLSPDSNVAVAVVSHLCESHARDTEATIADLLKISGADEQTTWRVLAELVRAEVAIEGFDPGGYRITREPAAITLLDVVTPFEPMLQNEGNRIARALRPTVLQYFRDINFAACAGKCPTDNPDEPANCPRSILREDANPAGA